MPIESLMKKIGKYQEWNDGSFSCFTLQKGKDLIDRNCDVLPIYYELLIVMFVSIINIYVEQNSQSLFILINIINIIQ